MNSFFLCVCVFFFFYAIPLFSSFPLGFPPKQLAAHPKRSDAAGGLHDVFRDVGVDLGSSGAPEMSEPGSFSLGWCFQRRRSKLTFLHSRPFIRQGPKIFC